jgi:hypothetical protein
MKKIILAFVVMASAAVAEDVKVETADLGASKITLHLQPFLTEADLATLRLVMTNEDALKLFVTSDKGYAALAVSPEDGFMVDGALVPSVIALADLVDADTAAKAVLAACDKAKLGKEPCVLVLEVGPKG